MVEEMGQENTKMISTVASSAAAMPYVQSVH